MLTTLLVNGIVFMLTSDYLARTKRMAMRKRVWFKVLSSLERGLVDSVIRVVDRPRSLTLIKVLARIVLKIKRALMSPVRRLMEEVGRPLAKKISMIALRWGNKSAAEWAEDQTLIRYLAIVDLNSSPGFKMSDALLPR